MRKRISKYFDLCVRLYRFLVNSIFLSWHKRLVVYKTIIIDLINGCSKKGFGFLNGLLNLDLGLVKLAGLIEVKDLVNHLVAVIIHHLSIGFVDVFVELSDLLEVSHVIRVIIRNLIDEPQIYDWQLVELCHLRSHIIFVFNV